MSKDLKQLQEVIKLVTREVNNAFNENKGLYKEIGDKMLKNIKERTRKGIGTSKSRKEKKFKRLKRKTIDRRWQKERDGVLSSETSPETSNLTETGSLVDNTKMIPMKDGFEIKPKKSDEKKAQGNENMGRTMFKLNKKDLEEVEDMLNKELEKVIKDINKTL